jgi:hypothetical protein
VAAAALPVQLVLANHAVGLALQHEARNSMKAQQYSTTDDAPA